MRLIAKALNRNPNGSQLRQSFCNSKKHHSSLCMKLKRKHEQELLCKPKQLHHTDTESFWKLQRQVKEVKRQTLLNLHELPPFGKSLYYCKALLQKQTPEFPIKENPNIKIDIKSLNKPFGFEEVKCGLKKLNTKLGTRDG